MAAPSGYAKAGLLLQSPSSKAQVADKNTTPGKLESTGTASGTVSSNALLSVPVEQCRDLFKAHFIASDEVVGLSASATLYTVGTCGL